MIPGTRWKDSVCYVLMFCKQTKPSGVKRKEIKDRKIVQGYAYIRIKMHTKIHVWKLSVYIPLRFHSFFFVYPRQRYRCSRSRIQSFFFLSSKAPDCPISPVIFLFLFLFRSLASPGGLRVGRPREADDSSLFEMRERKWGRERERVKSLDIKRCKVTTKDIWERTFDLSHAAPPSALFKPAY